MARTTRDEGGGAIRGSTVPRIVIGVTATLSLLMAAVTAVATVRWIQLRDMGTRGGFEVTTPSARSAPPPGPCTEQSCNFLVLGSDSRRGLPATVYGDDESLGGTSRADTIMLVHTDPRSQEAIVVSFPRDLWVRIPGRGFDRINAAFEGGPRRGGPQLMAQTISDLTGLRVDHYVYVDLQAFQDVVDAIGGVDMCVPTYHVNTPGWVTKNVDGEPTQVYISEPGRIADPNAKLNITPGCQRLDGHDALAYVRARHLPCDQIPDFARISRQQQFLRALINQMLRPSMIVRAPSLVPEVVEHLERDRRLLPSDLVYLVGQLRGVATGAVEFRAVPSVGAWVGSKSVLKIEPSAERLFAAIRRSGPLGDVGAVLRGTPPSEANTTVAVVDVRSEGAATAIRDVLADAGFDVTPGIVPDDESLSVRDAAIVFGAGAEAHARVVSAYFPDLPLVGPRDIDEADVAVVVTRSYVRPEPEEGPEAPGASCPEPA